MESYSDELSQVHVDDHADDLNTTAPFSDSRTSSAMEPRASEPISDVTTATQSVCMDTPTLQVPHASISRDPTTTIATSVAFAINATSAPSATVHVDTSSVGTSIAPVSIGSAPTAESIRYCRVNTLSSKHRSLLSLDKRSIW